MRAGDGELRFSLPWPKSIHIDGSYFIVSTHGMSMVEGGIEQDSSQATVINLA